MSGSIGNNNSAYGLRSTGVDLNIVDVGFWFSWGQGCFDGGPRYQYGVEFGIPGTYYEYQLYSDNVTGNIEFYGDTDGVTVISTGEEIDWNYYRLIKNGTDIKIYVSAQGSSVFTLVREYTGPSGNIDRIEIFQTGANDGLCVAGNIRSMRGYSVLRTESAWLAEKNSREPVVTTDMEFNYADGETPSATNWGVALSGLNLTQFGTAILNAYDPIPDATAINPSLFFGMCP
jgi:hypothetical protein